MKNITFILCCILGASLLQHAGAQSTETLGPRRLREVNFSGRGYTLGLQHGRELKKEIGEIVAKWKKNIEHELNTPADTIVKQFFAYARFDKAIKGWTPELYEEVRGIADGSGQSFQDIMVHNLLDEFWVWQDANEKHHCSGMGVPARDGNPAYIAQNMDLEGYTDGYQVLLRLAKTEKTPEQLILTYPGLIALNGLNEAGIGACMNTLIQLKANATGLPVAFIVRGILGKTDKADVLSFIQTVPHASGQNYIIGIRDEVYDFEASANKVVRFDPKNANGTVYHTNHPLANDDLKDWYKVPENGNSAIRLSSVQGRMTTLPSIKDADIKAALRAKDDPNHPVCRAFNRGGGTFGSVVMTLTGNPKLQITSGPPDESEYKEVRFTTGKNVAGEEGWRSISGIVVDETAEVLIGAIVMTKDPATGTYSGRHGTATVNYVEGAYSLMVPFSQQELMFTWDAGIGPEIVPLSSSDTLNVMLLWRGHIDSPLFDLSKKTFRRTAPIRVSGNIMGEKSAALRPCVRIEGTETKVYADENGHFDITVTPGHDILSFESDNYPARKVLLGNLEKVYIPVTLWSKPEKKKRNSKHK